MCQIRPAGINGLKVWKNCAVGILFGLLAGGLLSFAHTPLSPAPNEASVSVDAGALVRRGIKRRLDESRNHRLVRYIVRQSTGRQDTTKEVIETKDGDVDRLIAIDGVPLSAGANRAELARLEDLAKHPEKQEQRKKEQQDFKAWMNRLAALVPDAFLYRVEGMDECASGECYRVSFTPNPKFVPTDRSSSLFRGVAGEVWIDRTHEQLERLEARFISNVNFGLGILGKVNKGGTAHVEQREVGENEWALTSLKFNMTGRMFLVRSFRRQLDQELSHYSAVEPMDYREAIELLKKSEPDGVPGD